MKNKGSNSFVQRSVKPVFLVVSKRLTTEIFHTKVGISRLVVGQRFNRLEPWNKLLKELSHKSGCKIGLKRNMYPRQSRETVPLLVPRSKFCVIGTSHNKTVYMYRTVEVRMSSFMTAK